MAKLNPWQEQAKNPAAPRGVSQVAQQAAQYEFRQANPDVQGRPPSFLGQLTSQNGYVAQSKSWYTGANSQTGENGWDAGFAKKFIEGQEKAAKEKRLGTYFETETATGVVTWDHKSADGTKEFKFGDVYEDGKKVSNLYDERNGGFDEKTADLMMSDWLFDAKTKANIFGSEDSGKRMRDEVASKREQNNIEIPKQMKALDFADTVEAREKAIDEGGGYMDEAALFAAGFGGGAALGSVSLNPFVALGTGVVGGVGALLNQDQLTEMAARSYEITALASKENGLTAGIFEGISQWSGFAGKAMISPASNVVQGLYDAKAGTIGDGTSEFYAVDETTGERKASNWMQAADIAASVGDGFLQFASPLGVGLYTAQMTGQIGGKTGSLIASGGMTFDDRQGGFDSIFTNDKGEADWGAAAAGIGSIGIDVVQLGMARGLVNKADSSMRAIGAEARYGANPLAQRIDTAKNKLPTWAGGRSAEAKKVIAEGGEEVEIAGHKFLLDAQGRAVEGQTRKTLGLLAPSEMLPAISAKNIARREQAVKDGATKADDFYRAASSLANGERKMTSAIVNGFGEGYEEAIQAVLEPLSHNSSVDAADVISSFLYGGAMGVGMTMATNMNSSTADQKLFAQADAVNRMRFGGAELSKDEWKGMTPTEKRMAASRTKAEDALIKTATESIVRNQGHTLNAQVVGAQKLMDAVEAAKDRNLAKLTNRTDPAVVITQIGSVGELDADGNISDLDAYTMPPNAVGASAEFTDRNFLMHLEGLNTQRIDLQRAVTEATAAMEANAADPTLAETLAERQTELAGIEAVLNRGMEIREDLRVQLDRLDDPGLSLDEVEAEVAVINNGLRMMFNEVDPSGTMTPEEKRLTARAVSLTLGRHPHDSAGSYQVVVPQVSVALTMERSDNVLQVSQAILPQMRGDFDGDKLQLLNQIILDEDIYVAARSGTHALGAGGSVNVPAPKHEKDLLDKLATSLVSDNTVLRDFADGTLINISDMIRRRYVNVVDHKVLDRVLESFINSAKSGSGDARQVLMDGLAQKLGGQITEFSRDNLSNEWLWIDQLIRATMQRFQETYAANRPALGPLPDTSTPNLLAQVPAKTVDERRVTDAATLGMTLANVLPGDSLFRMFQKLHYRKGQARVLSADNPSDRKKLEQLAEFYEALSQLMVGSELDVMRGKDIISKRAMANLKRLAESAQELDPSLKPMQALTIIANLEVQDFDYDSETGSMKAGKVISLSQLLLKQSVRQDQRDKAVILEADQELQAKHSRLLRMTRPGGRGNSGASNAERAFLELAGQEQMFTLLGDDAKALGPHLTVEQAVRTYTNRSRVGRARRKSELQSDRSLYVGKKQQKNMPYKLEDLENGEVSAYRAVVDAILAVGNDRISMTDDSGTLKGELFEKSQRTKADFNTAHKQVRSAVTEYLKLSGRKAGEPTVEVVQRMFEDNPDTARDLMALIPNGMANAVFSVRDGEVWMSPWVYEMFVIQNSAEAEMYFWRNLLDAEWVSMGAIKNEEGATEDESARQLHRMKRRMHKIRYKLATNPDGGLAYAQFMEKMATATNLDDFIAWINTTPGILGEQAPITAWVDDVAEFEADKASGGWTTALDGAERREALSMLRDSSMRLVKSLTEEQRILKTDRRTHDAIRRVISYDRDMAADGTSNVVLQPRDREFHDRFEKFISEAGKLYTGLGPQAMITQSMGAVRGFFGKGHTKGVNPEHLRPGGMFEAVRDALGYVTNYERVLGALTSVSLDSVNANPNELAKDGVRTVDDDGRTVVWATPTVESMLDLLENSDTRPLARSILFPQVMERTESDGLRNQMLTSKSLTELLNGKMMNELFPTDDRLSLDSALRYVSMIEARARMHGGHFAVQRAVNDIVIAQTSAATGLLEDYELERMVIDAYQTVARILQGAGSVQSLPTPYLAEEQHKSLLDLKKAMKQGIRDAQVMNRLGVEGDDVQDAQGRLDIMVAEFKQAYDADKADRVTRLAAAITPEMSPADITEITSRFEVEQRQADSDFERTSEQIEVLRADDTVAAVVQMFSIPADPKEAVARKQALVEYVRTHRGVVERGSSLAITLRKLTNQLLDSGKQGQMPTMTDKEWDVISRFAIADYINLAAGPAGNNVSIAPFPDADHKDDHRYYDTSFSYLIDPLMDPTSPLVRAAQDLHRMAGRQEEVMADDELIRLVTGSIFKDFSLGRWTDDVRRSSVEANARLDSSPAAAAISIYGQSPKTQATISAAMRRTYAVPDATLASTATLTIAELRSSPFDEITVTHPGGVAVERPLIQMNNRFASAVVATLPDGSTVDLLNTTDVGRYFYGDPSAVNSGLQEIHLERILTAITDLGMEQKVPVDQISVDVTFMHPDNQPETTLDSKGNIVGENWMNNLYFEGTSFLLDADRHDNLNSTLWFANESISPAGQAQALDSSKLGQAAIQVIPVPTAAEVAALESEWVTDLGKVIREKARVLISTDMGFGLLDPNFFNVVHKNMKLRHFVQGIENGEPALWTAEKVIAWQAANPGQPLPLDNAQLWVPSDDVLRSMLGEFGTQGVSRVLGDQVEVDLASIPTYRGVTPRMRELFAPAIAGERARLEDTRVASRAHQSQLLVRAKLSAKQRGSYESRMKYFDSLRTEIWAERGGYTSKKGGNQEFNTRRNLANSLSVASKMIESENLSFDWSGLGVPFFAARDVSNSSLSELLLQDVVAALDDTEVSRSGWIYEENSNLSNPLHGVITKVNLGGSGGGMRVAPGDLVVFNLDGFNGDTAKAKKRLDQLTARGATIVLGNTEGRGDMRAELAEYLRGGYYDQVAASVHIFQPADLSSRFANAKARMSTLLETRGISRKNMLMMFHTTDKDIEENAAWVNGDNTNLRSIGVVAGIVPVDAFGTHNVPVDSLSGESQVAAVHAHINGMDNAVDRKFLAEMATEKIKDKAEREAAMASFDLSFTELVQRLNANPGTVLPVDTFGPGDLIPLVGANGSLLLYRHGDKAPANSEQVAEMQARTLPGSYEARRVAVYRAEPEIAATTYRGRVVEFSTDKHGLRVELEMDLSVFGDKKQVEWGGMKYVLTDKPKRLVLPDHGVLGDWGIDLIGSMHDLVSKEGFEGVVNNHRNAFAYFGIDFLPDVKKFLNLDSDRDARAFLRAITLQEKITYAQAAELQLSQNLGAVFNERLTAIATSAEQSRGVNADWVDRLGEESVEAQIFRAMVIYLMTPGAQVKHVLRSGSIGDVTTNDDFESILMPRLFTQVFDDAADSNLGLEINKRLNKSINNPNRDGTGYRLHTDFTFEIRNQDPQKNLTGFLQLAEVHSAGDNPVKNGQAFEDAGKGPFSAHTADIAYGALGARSAHKYDLTAARAFSDGQNIHRFSEKDLEDGGVWRTMKAVGTDKSFVPWRLDTPAESAYRSLSREAMLQFRQPIEKNKARGWSEAEIKEYRDLSTSLVQILGLQAENRGMVDAWARQWLGMPEGLNDQGEQHHVSGRQALEVVKLMRTNVDMGYYPTTGALVPLMDIHDLQAIYRASKGRDAGWKPRVAVDTNDRATSWNDWVSISFGTAINGDQQFTALYLTALDGFMHTYQSAADSMLDLPVSMDALVAEKLLLPENNFQVLASMDPNRQQIMNEPALLASEQATLEDLLGGRRVGGTYRGKLAPSSEVMKRINQHKTWRAVNNIPMQVDVTTKDFRKSGVEFIDHGTTTNAVVRILINLRVGTALINPALYISMGPELMIRNAIDQTANLLTGQATTGIIGRGQARRTEARRDRFQSRQEIAADLLNEQLESEDITPEKREQLLAELDALPTASLFERMGLESRYTSDQVDKLNVLFNVLGQRRDFKSMVFKELNYLRPHQSGIGRIERFAEGYAKFGTRIQDPTYGPRATTLGRKYTMAALEHILARPDVNVISVDTLIAQMMTDPYYLSKNYPEAHRAGLNAIAQNRSLKQTPLSLMLKSVYEPLSAHHNPGINIASNILLKLPMLFSNYAMNVITSITGLQGLSDIVAMTMDGRDKGPLMLKWQKMLKGQPLTPDEMKYDMREVLEGIDLSRSFIRGGITHTALMAFGLAAGGLGLSGEDEEERRRRRASQYQGAGYVYDPRKMSNDFRNADALWWGDSAFQPPWIAKQFLSPVVGIQRFLDTGDTRHVMWGFQDAIGAFPIINTMTWRDAVETGQDFTAMANAAAENGTKEGLQESHSLLTSMVGSYERMLFENAFVNQLYQGSDRYDRDPYAQPLLDSDETVQVDAAGQPRETTSLRPYYDSEGNLREGYTSRTQASAKLHALTENRATLAAGLSIFTGFGDSSFFRQNMVVKTRSFEAPALTDEEARAAVQSLMTSAGGSANLNQKEAMNYLRNQGVGGKYARNSELEPLAKKMVEGAGFAPLSMLDAAGREVLTKDGAKAVMRGLAKGSVTIGDPSLRGLHITKEQRDEIATEWMADIIQEGIDMGLDETTAGKRMQRLWQGPLDDPTGIGLADILYGKDISYSTKLEYNQLNTTFVKGPDGLPWATGFERSAVFGSVKFEKQIQPDKGLDGSFVGVMSVDDRMNSVDDAAGQNLGLRALEPVAEDIPTDAEIGEALEKAMEKALGQSYTPFQDFANSGSGGGGGYGRRGGGGYGGGGGGSYAPHVYFAKMNNFPDQRAPYADGIPFINTSNPILRRSDVRRERISSERGRLKQWQ